MARIGNFARDVDLLVSRHLSPEARRELAAKQARRILAEAQAANARVFGAEQDYTQAVDGRSGAALESVNPDNGHITFEFSLLRPALEWIGSKLIEHSPVGSGADPHPGLFARSIILLADGEEVTLGEVIPPAESYVFIDKQPYARKIERGESDQAKDGVFEVVADMAKRRFGNLANIRFTYRSFYIPSARSKSERAAERDGRSPAILVTPR